MTLDQEVRLTLKTKRLGTTCCPSENVKKKKVQQILTIPPPTQFLKWLQIKYMPEPKTC